VNAAGLADGRSLVESPGGGSLAQAAQGRSKISRQSAQPSPRLHLGGADEITNSIKERGIIQPRVRGCVKGTTTNSRSWPGERRWRSAQRAGLHECLSRGRGELDSQALEFAIIVEALQARRPHPYANRRPLSR